MINYKIATNDNLFQVETDKQGGGVMTATYPRQFQATAVSDDSFQLVSLEGALRLYNGKLIDHTINGTPYVDVYLFVEKLNEVVYSNGGGNSAIVPIVYTTSELAMIDPLGVFVTKNLLSDGSVSYTLQDVTPYPGDVTLLLPYTAQGEFILFSHTPAVLNNGQNEIVDVAVVGAILGEGYVTLTTNLTAFQNTSVNAFVIADDLVRIIIVNNTGGTINLPQLDFKYIK